MKKKIAESQISMKKNGWWYAKFKVHSPEDQPEPLWHVDLVLAHKILQSVLEKYKKDIILWRFHRRAVADNTGHQFSFIYYSSQQTAASIFADIRSNKLLKDLKKDMLLDKIILDKTKKISKPNVEDTSDPSWPPVIQKSWPYYIMGVSSMWFALISELIKEVEVHENATLEEIVAIYKKVDSLITRLWWEHGRHALLHHLNAIFEYHPILLPVTVQTIF